MINDKYKKAGLPLFLCAKLTCRKYNLWHLPQSLAVFIEIKSKDNTNEKAATLCSGLFIYCFLTYSQDSQGNIFSVLRRELRIINSFFVLQAK